MKVIKLLVDSPVDNVILWSISEANSGLTVESIIAIGTEDSLEKASAAALKRYREMETIDNPYDNEYCDSCEWCTDSWHCIKHYNLGELASCNEINQCIFYEGETKDNESI